MKPFTKRFTATRRGSEYSHWWSIKYKGWKEATFCPESIKRLFSIPKRVLVTKLVITNVEPSDFVGVYTVRMPDHHSDVILEMPDQNWADRMAMTWNADELLQEYFSRPGPIYIWVEYKDA